MITKSSRKIRSKSVRQMLTWGHYRFELFLKHKAAEYNKIVSLTGEVLPNLGSKKVVTGSDSKSLDRDLKVPRGIFIKSVVENPSITLGDTPSVI